MKSEKPKKKRAPAPAARASRAAGDADLRLALEAAQDELAAARAELSRIGSADLTNKRRLEETALAGKSSEELLREEVGAVRLDLKTALAELEIARADHQRAEARTQLSIREIADAKEAQRRAEHAGNSAVDEAQKLRTELQRLRAELDFLRPLKDEIERLRTQLANVRKA